MPVDALRKNPQLRDAALAMVNRACQYSNGRFEVAAVAVGLAEGRYRLWVSMELPSALQAAAVSTVRVHDSGVRAFELLLLGGPKWEQFLRFLPDVTEHAREAGCQKVTLFANRINKSLLPAEWRVAATLYDCDITQTEASEPVHVAG